MDVLAVREATRFATEYCPEKGPLVFEMATYRYHGHSMSDPGTSYRTREEIQEVRQTRDPIIGWKERMVSAGLADPDELKETEKEVRASVDADVKKAKADGEIATGELYNDVYQNFVEGTIRGLVPWERWAREKTVCSLISKINCNTIYTVYIYFFFLFCRHEHKNTQKALNVD